jgi:hypothetical protein
MWLTLVPLPSLWCNRNSLLSIHRLDSDTRSTWWEIFFISWSSDVSRAIITRFKGSLFRLEHSTDVNLILIGLGVHYFWRKVFQTYISSLSLNSWYTFLIILGNGFSIDNFTCMVSIDVSRAWEYSTLGELVWLWPSALDKPFLYLKVFADSWAGDWGSWTTCKYLSHGPSNGSSSIRNWWRDFEVIHCVHMVSYNLFHVSIIRGPEVIQSVPNTALITLGGFHTVNLFDICAMIAKSRW